MTDPTIDVLKALPAERVPAVLALLVAVAATDGIEPLSEHTLLHVRHGGEGTEPHGPEGTEPDGGADTEPDGGAGTEPDGGGGTARHVLIWHEGHLAGYAHVDLADPVEGAIAELAVHPQHRRRGLGRALVEAALDVTEDGRLRLWAHGEHPAAAALAHCLGFERARVLLQMRRPLDEPLDEPVLPPGVRLRPFRPGLDETDWVVLNNRAFASHPEQGRWTERDLALREAEPWFDPAGFLLAERESDGALLGFHWTKVHGAGAHGHEPIGEVYVLGVDPAAHGSGLGRALTLAGLRHLQSAGLSHVMLYVDESNTAAAALYARLGFTISRTDIAFRRG